jgi:hypothetical protein
MQLSGPRWAAAATGSGRSPVEEISFTYSKITVFYGQTLRLNLTYAADPAQAGRLAPAIRVTTRLCDIDGNTIYVSNQGWGRWETLVGGQSCSFDVNRDELPLPGDPRTGGLAVVPGLTVEVPEGMRPDFPLSLEVTDNDTGAIAFVGGWGSSMYQHTSDGGHTFALFGSLLSVTRGQTLQVNLTNTLPLTLANQPVAGIDYLINIKGINGELDYVKKGRLNPGQTIVASFDRDQLPDAGDSVTGRLSLAPEITYKVRLTPEQMAALGEMPGLPISFEIVDSTGNTTALMDSYYGRGVYKSMDSGRTW